jgi:hypothetical protein
MRVRLNPSRGSRRLGCGKKRGEEDEEEVARREWRELTLGERVEESLVD